MAPADLDPVIAAWLAAAPPADIDFSDVTAIRRMSDDYMRETGGPAPRYPHPNVTLLTTTIAGVECLVWLPKEISTRRPAVIAAHGGGFIVGSALGAERIAVPLAAQHQIITVSVEYRLAPQHQAPAAFDDMCAVLAALASGDTDLPVDPRRLAVHGSSAGGCLAAGTALWARDHGIPLAGQSLSCPALDDRVWDDVWSPTWTPQATSWMWRHYLPEGEPPPYVIPARIDEVRGVAPAHLVIARHDTLRSQAVAYAQRLNDAGVSVTVHDAPGTVHGYDGLLPDSDAAHRAIASQIDAIAGWLDQSTMSVPARFSGPPGCT